MVDDLLYSPIPHELRTNHTFTNAPSLFLAHTCSLAKALLFILCEHAHTHTHCATGLRTWSAYNTQPSCTHRTVRYTELYSIYCTRLPSACLSACFREFRTSRMRAKKIGCIFRVRLQRGANNEQDKFVHWQLSGLCGEITSGRT